jgi:hypothetical protein
MGSVAKVVTRSLAFAVLTTVLPILSGLPVSMAGKQADRAPEIGVETLQARIDAIVYELYALSAKEIKAVEGQSTNS